MNTNYLMQHISYHLHTIVKCFPQSGSPLWKSDSYFCARNDFHDEYLTPELLQTFMDTTFEERPTLPLLFSAENQIAYGLIPLENQAFLIGPIRFFAPVQLKYGLNGNFLSASWMETVPLCTFSDVTDDVRLLYNLFASTILTTDDLIAFSCIDDSTLKKMQFDLSELIFNTHETNLPHNPYDQELREFASIEDGDIDMLKKSLAEDYIGKIGTLAHDELRHMKNRAIVVIGLASRSAIRGGLLHEISLSMSDIQIQKIEEQTDPAVVLNLMHQFEFEYTQMVADLKAKKSGRYKKNQNLRVNQCKDYIFKHLHEKILIPDIADELHLNANYLSEIFQKNEGITIGEFILQEKLDLAKNLLVYSPYTYIEIASYLSFSSQSHLGKQFKKLTGMTLRQYRELYGVKELSDTHWAVHPLSYGKFSRM